jgi:hypothetical protein
MCRYVNYFLLLYKVLCDQCETTMQVFVEQNPFCFPTLVNVTIIIISVLILVTGDEFATCRSTDYAQRNHIPRLVECFFAVSARWLCYAIYALVVCYVRGHTYLRVTVKTV